VREQRISPPSAGTEEPADVHRTQCGDLVVFSTGLDAELT